jgi:N-acetylmuramoyl-L-alanine amidase
MRIENALLEVNFSAGRRGVYPVDTITIHVTEGDESSVRSWFQNPAADVSAHYLVCVDGRIVQFVNEEDTARANGIVIAPTAQVVLDRQGSNPNDWTVSIEHEGTGTEELTDDQRAASYWLIRDIVGRHPAMAIDREHILGHHEIKATKRCPGAISVDRMVQEIQAQI